MYSVLTYYVMKSYLTHILDKKIRDGNKGCYVIK